MSNRKARLVSMLALVTCALATQAQAATVYSLATDGTTLIRFDSATPGSITSVGSISGGTSRLDGLDFRPSDGLLYGYNHATGSVYTVNTSTGAVTLASALSTATNTNFTGIDFNPVADRLRIVTNTTQNLRVNVATGATIADTALAYAAADVNFGVSPLIIDAAYTNSTLGGAATTALYYVDYGTDTLVRTANANSGLLETVGTLGFDFDANTGFDIYSNGTTNSAFGAFRVAGVTSLYSIDLLTGAATSIGTIGTGNDFHYGLAFVPGNAVVNVPEPGSLALLSAAGLAALTVRRRKA